MTKKTDDLYQLFTFRVEKKLITEFREAQKREAEMHGFEVLDSSKQMRSLLREYIDRVNSTSASATARAAAKVLRGAPRKGARA